MDNKKNADIDILNSLSAKILKKLSGQESELTDDAIIDVIDKVLSEFEPDITDRRNVYRSLLIHRFTDGGKDGVYEYEILSDVCTCSDNEPGECSDACAVGAIVTGPDGKRYIDHDKCVDCGLCIKICHSGAVSHKSECIALVKVLKERKKVPVYAILAPSFVGQFGEGVTPERVKMAMRRLGFSDALEVAMAADIITMKEAEEYIERAEHGQDFMITSCCCPAFVKLVEKHKPNLSNLVSHSVSPMIACARLIKAKEPGAKVVFIGPCLAKRAEAKRSELAGAVDLVLTFKEVKDMLDAAGIDPMDDFGVSLPELAEASHDGRIYARSGGVTEAITRAVKDMKPDLDIRATKGNGLKQCAEILKAIESGDIDANFMEGMACPGGCVGGPGTLIPSEIGAKLASEFAGEADAFKAAENAYAMDLMDEWGNKISLSSFAVASLV